jgi:two-component system response regulator GlrR
VDLGAGVANADAACTEQHGIVTENPRMLQLLSKLRLVANTHSNILFHGESGTGKELFARAVHKQSTRASGPFVALNCAALPEGVLESELFGHLRGAFTGAIKDRPGLFRAADGGTLFLDEIGDMPVHFQPRLLRALEERQITPVGGTVPVPVNIRLISATHQPVNKLVETQGFRSDLLYRINTVTLEIPPLRERPEDIRLLARHFLQEIALKEQRQVNSFSAEALELLVLATWPGNVRQLHNVVEQVVALTTGPVVSADLVTAALQGEVNDLLPLADARQEFERRYLLRVLKVAEGNVARAAQLAHRNRTEFYRLMRRHHLNNHSFKSGVERS